MDNQKLNQINNRVAIIGALIFLVYCVALFLFSGIFTSTAAVSLVFVVIAFLATFAIPRVAIKHPDVEAVFFGIPMMGFAVYYFFAEIFVSAVFIAFQEHISFKIALFIQLIILVAFVIISIVSFTAQSSIAQRSEDRKQQVVKSAFNTLSFSELEAIIHIFDELDGAEGILVASKIADRVGITRSVIVNALRKFESAGVIESRSSGMKGTYIKVLNDVIFDELEEIKAQRSKQ